MKSAKKKHGKSLIILGCCCILAAAALFGYNSYISEKAAQEADELAALLEKSMASSEESTQDPELGTPANDETDMTSKSVQGYDLIGTLSIPAIDRNLPIISQWSYPNLRAAPCRYSGTPEGQMVLLAHNYAKHFGHLKDLQKGDSVTFTDVSGKAYQYTVSKIETVDGYQLSSILSGKDWDLTLFTCTYGGKQRVVVRCVKA
jgi:sortase A